MQTSIESQALPSRLPSPNRKVYNDFIIVSQSVKTYIIPVAEIFSVQAKGNYCLIESWNSSILASFTLKYFFSLLDPSKFIRVHHSYCINASQIREIHKKNQDTILLSNGASIPISKTYKTQLQAYLISIVN